MDKGLVNILEISAESVEEVYGEGSLEAKFYEVLLEAFKLFVRKQADYGPTNIGVTGLRGIIVRMADKVSRLVNLFNSDRLDKANNESIEDTLLDLLNYSGMGLLDYRGEWPRTNPEDAWEVSSG